MRLAIKCYCKIILLSCLCVLTLVSCAPKTKTGNGGDQEAVAKVVPVVEVGSSAARKTKPTRIGTAIDVASVGTPTAKFGEMMDMQELEMRTALAHSEAAVIERQGDMLAIRLKGDLAFDTNSAAVRPGLFAEVERMTTILNKYPKTVILVGGHTDSQGSEAYNRNLSRQRADAVKNIMTQLGMSQARIEAAAFGESQPIATNDTEAGRMINRRVEIKIAPSQ